MSAECYEDTVFDPRPGH